MQSAYAQIYEDLYRNHFWWQARRDFLLKIIGGLKLKSDSEILDVGCGNGLFFMDLAAFGVVSGIESDPSLVSNENPNRSAIFVGAIDDFKTDRRFDLILLLDVLEHLDDDTGALKKCASLLKPDGRILITVPSFEMIWTKHDDHNLHKRRYTMEQLKRICNACELETINATYFFLWLAFAKVLTRIKESLTQSQPKMASVPSKWINRLFYLVSRIDFLFSNHFFGSSLMLLARKRGVK